MIGTGSSRRAALLGLGAGGLGLVIPAHPTAHAQQATPVAGPQPLVGSWFFFDFAEPNATEGQWLFTFAADGSVSSTARLGQFSPGHGAWAATGPTAAQANVAVFVTDPDFGQEMWTFHLDVSLDADGRSLRVTTTFDVMSASGAISRGNRQGLVWGAVRITADPDQAVAPSSD